MKIRIWKGKEVEPNGNIGRMTVFVETNVVNNKVLDELLVVLEEHQDIESIYFGAGEVDIGAVNVSNTLRYRNTLDPYYKYVECEIDNFDASRQLMRKLGGMIVLAIRKVPKSVPFLLKVRNTEELLFPTSHEKMRLDELQSDNLYKTDVLLVEKELII